MDRLFDVNLLDDAGWTDGEEWADCNPAQDLERVYKRVYTGSEEDDRKEEIGVRPSVSGTGGPSARFLMPNYSA